MPKKPKKHPQHMTTDEAIRHLFHPKVIKHAQHHAENPRKPRRKTDPK